MTITATRYHDISVGHRVYQHESKCAMLHGHNYRVHFEVQADAGQLDSIGRVIDFSVIKSQLCMWLEDNWDHKFLVWKEDPWAARLTLLDPTVVQLDFNPTAENLAAYLVQTIGPAQFHSMGVTLMRCTIDETRKCSATYEKD